MNKKKSLFPIHSKKVFTFCYFFIFYLILFIPRINGAGQYWDATFPFFKTNINNFFTYQSYSWIPSTGEPLGYTSDYFFRFFLSRITFMQPEHLLYITYVILFSLGSYGFFLIISKNASRFSAILIGLVLMISPAIYYNLIAGYIAYLVSFVIFIYFLHYLFYKFNDSSNSYFVIGIFLAFIGIAIQFFVFAYLVLCIFFAFWPKKFKFKLSPIIFFMPLLTNAVWISNILDGGVSLTGLSSTAAKEGFTASMFTSYSQIFNFSFAHATLIERLYPIQWIYVFPVFVSILLGMAAYAKRERMYLFILVNFIIFVFLGTGFFQTIHIPILSVFYPMFRESGHFAPVITLFLLLFWIDIHSCIWRRTTQVMMIFFIFINIFQFTFYAQPINFQSIRNKFAEFQSYISHQNKGNHILTYPFFGQYGFLDVATNYDESSFRLNNTGHDSYLMYSGLAYINNDLRLSKFNSSLQYELLNTFDLRRLAQLNIHSLFDFSNIYESYYNKYVPAETYDNDISLIKTNQKFFSTLSKKNPNLIKQISPHIYEIPNSAPYITGFSNLNIINVTQNTSLTFDFITDYLKGGFNFVREKESSNAVPARKVLDVYNGITANNIDIERQSIITSITAKATNTNKLYLKKELFASFTKGKLIFYRAYTGTLIVNNNVVATNDNREIIKTVDVPTSQKYYLKYNGSFFPLIDGNTANLGQNAPASTSANLYTVADNNAIRNSSFNNGLWQNKVMDCNQYDNKGHIGMYPISIDTSTQGIQLEATTHIACTEKNIPINTGSYVFSFDYQSDNAPNASYSIGFNDPEKHVFTKILPLLSNSWQHYEDVLNVPKNASIGYLYIYANSLNNKTKILNNYSNFSLKELNHVSTIDLPATTTSYSISSKQPSKKNTNVFIYKETKYNLSNILPNGSFEKEAWQPSVGDCYNYDDHPGIAMSMNTKDKTADKQSLQLEATRHYACTWTLIPVNRGSTYLLSFDYQSPNAALASYYIGFSTGNGKTFTKNINQYLTIADTSWHKYTSLIQVPNDATSLSLFFYAKESDGRTNIINRYDNVKLIEIRNLTGTFYFVNDPQTKYRAPMSVTFDSIDPTKKLVHIKGASTPFYLAMGENFHPKWQLMFNNQKVQGIFNSWIPWIHSDRLPDSVHFRLNDLINGWYFNTNTYCKDKSLCTKNADGTYNIELIIEFFPQRWFYIGLTISLLTITICTIYLFKKTVFVKIINFIKQHN